MLFFNIKSFFPIICVALICVVSGCEFDPNNGTIPLSGPLSIQVTPKDGELVVQWSKTAPARGVSPSYELYYSTSPTPGTNYIEVPTSASNLILGYIPGLVNHQIYFVWVRAVFEGLGKSGFSPRVQAEPIPPPETPGYITLYAGHEMLELRWDDVEDAFTYEVYYSTGGGAEPPNEAQMIVVPEPGIVLHKLANGVSYSVWVRAGNTAGNSGYQTNSGIPATGGIPAAPGNIALTGGDGKLTVKWDQVLGVPEYLLYYSTIDDFQTAATGQTVASSAPRNTAEITGLASGVTYYVWVVSSNGAGNVSVPSPSASALTQAKPAIEFNTTSFVLGTSTAVYAFAQDLPVSAFWPLGRSGTDRLTRVQETALGNLFADGAAWYLRNKQSKIIDFVFINGGYVDNALLKGNITVGSLMGIVKPDSRYDDKLVIVTLSGSALKKFFYDPERETSLAKWIAEGDVAGVSHTGRGSANTGFFGVVSSEVRYTLEYPQAPPANTVINNPEPWQHGRIKDLAINGAPIDDGKTYRIGTTDYLASGAYFTGLHTDRIAIEGFDILFWRGVAEYIYNKESVTPYLDGRIRIEGGVPLPMPWVNSTWTPDWLP